MSVPEDCCSSNPAPDPCDFSWRALPLGATGDQHHAVLPGSAHGRRADREVHRWVAEAVPAQSSDPTFFSLVRAGGWALGVLPRRKAPTSGALRWELNFFDTLTCSDLQGLGCQSSFGL